MRRMDISPARSSVTASPALRLARKAWRLQYPDARRSLALAEQALARAAAGGEIGAEGWARLARGFHRMRYSTAREAAQELAAAQRCFEATRDRAGEILAMVGIGRCWLMEGRYRESLDLVLPLRAEGLRILRQEERGMLLNGIAGSYSALGESAEAFAYMYQALRESRAARNHGFDAVLSCNLAHELYQLGDYAEALRYIEEGIERCQYLDNARLLSVLLVNRIVCLTDLGRPREALPDIRRLLELPADATGRGLQGASFESMAIAALRAGERPLGHRLVERARESLVHDAVNDERIELMVAEAEALRADGNPAEAAAHMERALPLPSEGPSLRVRCLFFETLADLHQRVGNAALALQHLRAWQALHVERARRASQARYQAASLQTELLRIQRERDAIDARRRATERARAELEAINRQLSQKVREVQSLQTELRQQAVRDFLTGLFNRRHLNEVLPAMFALAQRERAPLAVAIIDLDHFKAVNDRYGHAAGDRLLTAFGELLARRVRRSDVACRYGGEEFCLLMPHTGARAAGEKVSALLKLWRNTGFDFDGLDEPRTLSGNTFSAGVADSLQAPDSLERLLKSADDCVLEAKRLGRDRVVVFGRADTAQR
jgi:diguanylate cyclase (GGDEF)-like protein